jgi:hypothetical protein
MTVEEAKALVLAKYPQAVLWRGYKGPKYQSSQITDKATGGWKVIGEGDNTDAWIDAAERLQAQQKDEVEGCS